MGINKIKFLPRKVHVHCSFLLVWLYLSKIYWTDTQAILLLANSWAWNVVSHCKEILLFSEGKWAWEPSYHQLALSLPSFLRVASNQLFPVETQNDVSTARSPCADPFLLSFLISRFDRLVGQKCALLSSKNQKFLDPSKFSCNHQSQSELSWLILEPKVSSWFFLQTNNHHSTAAMAKRRLFCRARSTSTWAQHPVVDHSHPSSINLSRLPTPINVQHSRQCSENTRIADLSFSQWKIDRYRWI